MRRTSLPDLRSVIDDDGAPIPAATEPTLRLIETTPDDISTADPRALQSLVSELLAELKALQRKSARIVVKSDGRMLFLRVADIDWVEACGNYVKVHVGTNAYMCRESMKNMEARLDGDMFLRIHRSSIVNVEQIRQLEPWSHGEYVVQLADGTRLMASRVFSERIARFIV